MSGAPTAGVVLAPSYTFQLAAAILRTRGWTQNRWTDPRTGAVCLDRALHDAAGAAHHPQGDSLPASIRRTVTQVLAGPGGPCRHIPVHDLPAVATHFNDHVATTIDDVLTILDRCAAHGETST